MQNYSWWAEKKQEHVVCSDCKKCPKSNYRCTCTYIYMDMHIHIKKKSPQVPLLECKIWAQKILPSRKVYQPELNFISIKLRSIQKQWRTSVGFYRKALPYDSISIKHLPARHSGQKSIYYNWYHWILCAWDKYNIIFTN